jgi:DNA (cytosine-5)-methyltransferase 1
VRHLDLFSGIGGFALAASWVWGEEHEIVSFCEIEDYPQRVLKKHWPTVPCHGDIKTLKGDSFGTVDLITGGFPCQPFSVAGKQGGSSDDRHLWPEMFRVIQEARPTWIIGENVAGLVNMVEFEQCFLDLESEGYETQALIVPACGVGARHRRDRVWIVANHENWIDRENYTRAEKRQIQKPRESSCRKNVADPSGKRLPSPTREKLGSIRESEKSFQGCKPSGRNATPEQRGTWSPEPRVGRVANGVPSRVDRLKGLGNAIVPQCVVPIMQAIKELSQCKPAR